MIYNPIWQLQPWMQWNLHSGVHVCVKPCTTCLFSRSEIGFLESAKKTYKRLILRAHPFLGCMADCKSIWAWALSWGLFLALETHAIHHQLKIQYLCGHILQDIESTIESRGRQSQLFQRLILWKLEVQHQRDKKRRHMRVLQSLSHI